MNEQSRGRVEIGYCGGKADAEPVEYFLWHERGETGQSIQRHATVHEIMQSQEAVRLLSSFPRDRAAPTDGFAVGDVVVLKSGGPSMTITERRCGGEVCLSVWDGDHRLQEVEISAACLRLATIDETLPLPPF